MSNRDDVPVQVNAYADTDADELRVLSAMDGFSDSAAIARRADITVDGMDQIIRRLRHRGVVRYLGEWTLLHWCDACDVPLMSEFCSLCGNTSRNRIVLRPPSNPKVIDKFYSDVLESLEVTVRHNMVVNPFKQGGVQKFELIHRRKLAEFAFDEKERRWRLENGVAVDCGEANPTEGDRRTVMQRIVGANRTRLDSLEKSSIDVICTELANAKPGAMPLFYHSGGKDSIVAFELLLKAQSGVENNTINMMSYELGIDFPETLTCIEHDIARYPGLVNFYYYSHKEVFLKTIEKIGPPALGNIWCCPQSETPAKKILRDLYGGGSYIGVKGHRKRETMEKLLWAPEEAIYVQRRAFEGERLLCPIWMWTDFDVWLYIHKHELKHHPIYDIGVQRLACAMCPVHSDSEQRLINERNPELLHEFDGHVRRWKERLGLPEEWIERRSWRVRYPEDMESSALKISDTLAHVDFESPVAASMRKAAEASEWVVVGKIREPIALPALRKYLRVTVDSVIQDDGIEMEFGDARVALAEPNVVTVKGKSRSAARKMAVRVGELINVYINCIGCRFCEDKCGCLVVAYGRVQAGEGVESGCSKCHTLLSLCPVSRSKYVNFANLFGRFRRLSVFAVRDKY